MEVRTLKVPTPDGGVTEMPAPQAVELVRLFQRYPDSTWHWNDCECCICLHPDGDKSRGYIINSDGESSYHEGGDE